MKTLVFQFDNNYMFRLMQGAVWVDGQRLTIFKEKVKEKRVELPEGAKELVLTIEKYSSMPIAVANLPENQIHYFKVRSRVGNAFYIVAYVLFLCFSILLFWQNKSDVLNWIQGFTLVPFIVLICMQIFRRKGMVVVSKVE